MKLGCHDFTVKNGTQAMQNISPTDFESDLSLLGTPFLASCILLSSSPGSVPVCNIIFSIYVMRNDCYIPAERSATSHGF